MLIPWVPILEMKPNTLLNKLNQKKAPNVNETITVPKNKEQLHFFFFQCQYIRWDRSPSHEKNNNNDKNNNP